MRGILSVGVGAVLGALVVVILLHSESAVETDAAVATDGRGAASSAIDDTGDSTAADAGESAEPVTPDRLASLADPAARRAAALALLDVYGHDADGIDRVAASLPPIEAINFRIDAIVQLGASDMDAAFALAMSLDDAEQRRLALLRLAPVFAETDPLAAIAAIASFDSPTLQSDFTAALLDHWAVIDPARVFAFLESADLSGMVVTDAALAALAASNPDRLLTMAGDLRRDIAALATTAALESLIDRDPQAALARIDALPPGSDKSQLQHTAAQVYGERDPEAAWTWATESGVDSLARIGVVRGIQKVDPDMAWDIMLSQLNSQDDGVRGGTREYLMNYVNAVVNSESSDDVITGLDRLLSLNDPRVDADMQTNLQAWANRDPEAALDWSMQHLDRVNSERLLSSLSAGLARTNVELARATVFRLDEEDGTAWATGVGRTLAETDLPAARTWAYEMPQGPLRDAGLQEVIRGEAHGGTVDRQLFDQFSSDAARDEAASIAARRFACDGRTELALDIARSYITEQGLLDQTERSIGENTAPGSFASSFLCQFSQ